MIEKKVPLLSIIVPVYNVEKYIVQCLTSLANQTEKRIEIILVNDGSKDNSGMLCDQFALENSDMDIKVIHKKNGGLSSARNCGIEMAQTKYITFVDSDDYISPDFSKVLIDCAEANGADVVVAGYCIEKGSKKKFCVPDNEIMSREAAIEKLCNNTKIKNYAWGKVYRRSIFEHIKFPEGRCFEDIATTYKIFQLAEKIVSIDFVSYFYRIREDGITGKSKVNPILDYHRCMAYIERYRDLCSQYPRVISKMLVDLIYSIGMLVKVSERGQLGEYIEINDFAKDILEGVIPGYDNLDWSQRKILEEIHRGGMNYRKLRVLHFIGRVINKYKNLREIV